MKKIMFLLVITFFVMIIYIFTINKQQNIVLLGDYVCINNQLETNILRYKGNNVENYVNKCKKDMDTQKLLNMLDNNDRITYNDKQYNIHNLLIKANIIIISIGMNDIVDYNNSDNIYYYLDNVLLNVDKILSKVRYISKEQIYIYNYFGIDEKYLNYVNERLSDITKNYKVKIIDISNINNKKRLTNNDYKLIIDKTIKTI